MTVFPLNEMTFNMVDGKDGDGKRAYVNMQTNTDSIANPDTMFEKMINNQNKSLEIVREDPSSPKRDKIHTTLK